MTTIPAGFLIPAPMPFGGLAPLFGTVFLLGFVLAGLGLGVVLARVIGEARRRPRRRPATPLTAGSGPPYSGYRAAELRG